jgi:predicted CopG family antitoxin
MKTINETFTDDEFNSLLKLKKDLSWHDFILSLIQEQNGRPKTNKNN